MLGLPAWDSPDWNRSSEGGPEHKPWNSDRATRPRGNQTLQKSWRPFPYKGNGSPEFFFRLSGNLTGKSIDCSCLRNSQGGFVCMGRQTTGGPPGGQKEPLLWREVTPGLGSCSQGSPSVRWPQGQTPPGQQALEEACPPQPKWHFRRLTGFYTPREKRNKKQVGKNHFPGCQQLLWGPPEDPSQTSSSARASSSGPRGR